MKAVCITKHGSPDVIKYLDIDEPECNRKSIKVKIKASSINHLDLWVRKGIENHPVKFPRILGSDGAGEIIELGADVRGYNIGDDVVIQPGIFSSDSKIKYLSDLINELILLFHISKTFLSITHILLLL